ncbi:MAG: hypothetical protein M1820_008655 [Bogoriella megaspora]|nr:MAG: hypothetical protein M1820_008655 [Bogoriella megaspora]
MFGFLRNQVTPFAITSHSGEKLYAWHILPLQLYKRHEIALLNEASGYTPDITGRHAFTLLGNNPKARLIIHMHGAAGTVGSGYRVPNYRALSAGDPENSHVLTFDYGGFGYSKGQPSEKNLCLDAIAIVEWALNVAKIPPSRILIFGQSLGTAVNIAVAEHFASKLPPVVFAGHLLVAPFVDVATLMATYKVAGTIPLLGPVANIPPLFGYLKRYVKDQWSSKSRIANYIHAVEASGEKYHITIIHAEDDYDIPWTHSKELYWRAVNATRPIGVSRDELEEAMDVEKKYLGPAGSVFEWKSENGAIREEILKTGLHDVIMGNPVVSLAVMRIFANI